MTMLTKNEWTIHLPDESEGVEVIVTTRWKVEDKIETSVSVIATEYELIHWFVDQVMGYTISADRSMAQDAWDTFRRSLVLGDDR